MRKGTTGGPSNWTCAQDCCILMPLFNALFRPVEVLLPPVWPAEKHQQNPLRFSRHVTVLQWRPCSLFLWCGVPAKTDNPTRSPAFARATGRLFSLFPSPALSCCLGNQGFGEAGRGFARKQPETVSSFSSLSNDVI